MDLWQQIRGWLRREAADARDAKDDLERRLDRDLTNRERRLNETPSEAMERLQREIADHESSFDQVRDRIGTTSARADARAEVAREDDGTERDPDDLDRPVD